MSKIKVVTIGFITTLAFSVIATSSASAAWVVEHEELASGSTAALAATASVSEGYALKFGFITIKCTGETLNSVKPELTGSGKLVASSLIFSGCAASGGGCAITQSTIGTLPIAAELTQEGSLEASAAFKAQTGSLLATIKFTSGSECAYSGEVVPLTGKITTKLPTGQEEETTQNIDTNVSAGSGELKVGFSAAEFKGVAVLKLASAKPWMFLAAPPPPPRPTLEALSFMNDPAISIDHRNNPSHKELKEKQEKSEAAEKPITLLEYNEKEFKEKNEIAWRSPKASEVSESWPVAYVKEKNIEVKAKFGLEKATQEFLEKKAEGEAVVKGKAVIGGEAITFTMEAGQKFVPAPHVEVVLESNTLPKGKAFYEDITITWEWKVKEKGQPKAIEQEIEKSSHNLYVLFDDPETMPLYFTFLDLDTKGVQSQAGALEEKKVIAGVWEGFAHKEKLGECAFVECPQVHLRVYTPKTGKFTQGGTVMWYYSSLPIKPGKTNLKEIVEEEKTEKQARRRGCPGGEVAELLEWAEGRCGVWARTLKYALAMEGIDSEVVSLEVEYGKGPCAVKSACAMLIKEWKFGAGTGGEFPFAQNEIVHEEGATGQGVEYPPPWFWDHAIVKAGPSGEAQLYDPSYGTGAFPGTEVVKPATVKSVLEEYQKKSIDGFCEREVAGYPIKCQSSGATGLGLVAAGEGGAFEFPN